MEGGSADADEARFVEPTILCDVDSSMRVFREEIFGPVAPIIRFGTEEEAIALANDTEFGLASYVFTSDQARAWRVGEAMDFGMVGVNETMISNASMPFGGIKESGQGREGSHLGMDEYVETKFLCFGNVDG